MSLSQAFAPTFGIIATASIVSNALFCFLLYKKPGLLKKPHNILLLSLATIDMMTGNPIVSWKSNLLTKTYRMKQSYLLRTRSLTNSEIYSAEDHFKRNRTLLIRDQGKNTRKTSLTLDSLLQALR